MLVSTLQYFERFFETSYALNKLDLISIPNFVAGAMENWGCITFREEYLLVSQDSSTKHKQRVAYVIAHEIAHQWFGNLVTLSTWNDLWLNEGFATWAGYKAVSSIYYSL